MSQSNTREPLSLVAGDTISFTRTLADYPATDGWSLKYEARSGGGQPIEFSSTPDVDSHVILVGSDITATWLPGDYVLSGFAELSGQRFEVYRGSMPVTVNPETEAGDTPVVTFAQQMVEALQKTIMARANGIQESTFGETRFKFWTPRELNEQLAYWELKRKNEVDIERAKAGFASRNRITPQFNISPWGSTVNMPIFRGTQ